MSTWTDREKLTYLISAMEFSGFRPDFKVTPPNPLLLAAWLTHAYKRTLRSRQAAPPRRARTWCTA
jgi:hypothetical protein